jgi:hypothetical protein
MKLQRLATIKRRVMTEEAAALGSNAQGRQTRGKKLRICCKCEYGKGD